MGESSIHEVMECIGSLKEELLSVKSCNSCIKKSMKLFWELESIRKEDEKFRECAILDALKLTTKIIKSSISSSDNIFDSKDAQIANTEQNEKLVKDRGAW